MFQDQPIDTSDNILEMCGLKPQRAYILIYLHENNISFRSLRKAICLKGRGMKFIFERGQL